MKITMGREELMALVTVTVKVVERRNTIPILANIKILANTDNTITVVATDLDVEVSSTAPATVVLPGETTVDAIKIADIIKKFPAEAVVEMTTDKDKLVVRSGRSRFSLNTLPVPDFPTLNVAPGGHSFDMPAADMLKIIDTVSFAVSTEETRYYLNGIYLHSVETNPKEAKLRGVATDGHRLALVDVDLPAGAKGINGVIVPRKALSLISTVAGASPAGTINVGISPTQIRVSSGKASLVSKLVDGTYPDYGRVIPTSSEHKATLAPSELRGAVDRISTVLNKTSSAIKFEFAGEELAVSASNSDTGSAKESLEFSGEGFAATNSFSIGFNGRYVLDVLSKMNGDAILIEMGDPGSPARITTPGDTSIVSVLMPMRV